MMRANTIDRTSRRGMLRLLLGGMAAACVPRIAIANDLPWVDQQQIGPFVVRANYSLTSDAVLLSELPTLEAELRRVMGLAPCRSLVTLYLYATREQHAELLAREFPGVPYRRALYVNRGGEAQIYTYRSDSLAIDLRHESTHAVLHSDVRGLPLWLDEGLAEYFEESESRRAGGHEHLKSVRWNARLGSITPISQLAERVRLDEMTALDYRHAWAWVHFMLHGPTEGHAQLVRYLTLLRNQKPAGEFAWQLEQAVPDSYRRMTEHFLRWQPIPG